MSKKKIKIGAIINVQKCDNHTCYWLTTNGLKWLGRQLNIVIKEDGKEN